METTGNSQPNNQESRPFDELKNLPDFSVSNAEANVEAREANFVSSEQAAADDHAYEDIIRKPGETDADFVARAKDSLARDYASANLNDATLDKMAQNVLNAEIERFRKSKFGAEAQAKEDAVEQAREASDKKWDAFADRLQEKVDAGVYTQAEANSMLERSLNKTISEQDKQEADMRAERRAAYLDFVDSEQVASKEDQAKWSAQPNIPEGNKGDTPPTSIKEQNDDIFQPSQEQPKSPSHTSEDFADLRHFSNGFQMQDRFVNFSNEPSKYGQLINSDKETPKDSPEQNPDTPEGDKSKEELDNVSKELDQTREDAERINKMLDEIESLNSENEKLKSENAQLKKENKALRWFKDQYTKLKNLLNGKKQPNSGVDYNKNHLGAYSTVIQLQQQRQRQQSAELDDVFSVLSEKEPVINDAATEKEPSKPKEPLFFRANAAETNPASPSPEAKPENAEPKEGEPNSKDQEDSDNELSEGNKEQLEKEQAQLKDSIEDAVRRNIKFNKMGKFPEVTYDSLLEHFTRMDEAPYTGDTIPYARKQAEYIRQHADEIRQYIENAKNGIFV